LDVMKETKHRWCEGCWARGKEIIDFASETLEEMLL
jgi:hypothetical protein